MKYTIVAAAFFLLLATGCRFEKIGQDLSSGVSRNSEAIGKNLITGVNKGMSDSAFRQSLYHLVDSLVATAGGSAGKTVKGIMDTLLSDRWIAFTRSLMEEATGRKVKENLTSLRNELLGAETNQRIRLLVATAMNEVLNEDMRLKLAALRDELTGETTLNNISKIKDSLIGPKTNAAIRAIVDSAMLTIAYRMKHDVRDAVGENASFIQKYAGRLLLLLGAIAAAIILLIWRLKQKYAKAVTVLTSQINSIPDQQSYDELTTRIKEKAVETGVEPTLRKVLSQNGLLGRESWETRQLKNKSILQNKN